MLPRPARPAETESSPAESGTSFVPPLAPSPPPAVPPTIHRPTSAAASNSDPGALPPSAPAPAQPEADAFDGILRQQALPPEDSRVHHLRGPSRIRLQLERPAVSDTTRRIVVTAMIAAAVPSAYLLTRSDSGWPVPVHGGGDVLDPGGSHLGVFAWVWVLWLPVFAGGIGYAIHQWLPSQRSNPRHGWTGPVTASGVVLGTLWLWAAQSGSPAAAFWLAAALVGIGLTAIHLGTTSPAGSRSEQAVTDIPSGILLGVGSLALLVCLGSWLVETDADVGGWGAEAWTLIALVSLVVGVTTVCMTGRGQLPVALSVVFGLTGLGFARLLANQPAVWMTAAAFIAGFLVIVSAGSRRHQVDHARRRAQREWLKAEASARADAEEPEAVHI